MASTPEPYFVKVVEPAPVRTIKAVASFVDDKLQLLFTESGLAVDLRGEGMIAGLEQGQEVELEMRDGKVGRGWIVRAVSRAGAL